MSDGVKKEENYSIDNTRPPTTLTTDDLETSALRPTPDRPYVKQKTGSKYDLSSIGANAKYDPLTSNSNNQNKYESN